MTDVVKLKKKAAEFEQKRQFDKALAVYAQLIEATDNEETALDVSLFNRVGDLMLRQGDVAGAVELYERAVDLYAEGGFFNNAIALCNKILRTSPGRTSIYYKLGKISARKGFASDAKQSFLEYADRMQRGGQIDEAFRALKEFADLCPDQDDVRLMLAEQLSKKNRKSEAIGQLQTLYEKFTAEGRTLEAEATAERMRAIDPTVEPKAEGGPRKEQKPDGLVFLDLSDGTSGAPRRTTRQIRTQAAPSEPPPPALADLPLLDLSEPVPASSSTESVARLELEPAVEGLDESASEPLGTGGLAGLEPTSFSDDVGESGVLPAVESIEVPLALTTEFEIAELAAPEDEAPKAPEHDLVLGGDLPLLDLSSAFPTESGSLESADSGRFEAMPGASSLAGLTFPADNSGSGALIGDAAREEGSLGDEWPESESMTAGAPPSLDGLPMLDVGLPADETPSDFMAAIDRPAVSEDLPPRRRTTTSVLAMSAETLEEEIRRDPSNQVLRRRFGEALLERGDREEGLHQLELAMTGFQTASDIESAMSVADEIIRLNPNSVRHHQKRVEYAFLLNDQRRLVEAYLELADGLFRSGQAEKARTIYHRVLELAPDDLRAQAALSAFVDAAPVVPPERPKAPSGTPRRQADATPYAAASSAQTSGEADQGGESDFINLGDWLRADDVPKSTRMVVPEEAPTGDEAADFADMLKKFKRGVAENVDEEDHQSHYDLGVAFKEMGLVDEAIGEFQKALRGPGQRIRTCEALGQCFVEKSQHQIALTILQRALADDEASDDQLVGVLYLLGYCAEAMKQHSEAITYYQRVFAVDIEFRDVMERIASLEKVVR